jgi:hypothetical protein
MGGRSFDVILTGTRGAASLPGVPSEPLLTSPVYALAGAPRLAVSDG